MIFCRLHLRELCYNRHPERQNLGVPQPNINMGVLTRLNKGAFSGCTSLKAVYISDLAAWCNIKFYDSSSNPLYYANNLYLDSELVTNLEIPQDVEAIGKYAFYGCTSIESMEIPDSVKTIGERAFGGCHIKNATGPASAISYIPKNNLQTVVITSGDSIGSDAFSGCTSLESVTIPDSVTTIGRVAFSGCTSLKTINYRGSAQQWSTISKGDNWDYNTGRYTINYNYEG